jgi:hypothetical protein
MMLWNVVGMKILNDILVDEMSTKMTKVTMTMALPLQGDGFEKNSVPTSSSSIVGVVVGCRCQYLVVFGQILSLILDQCTMPSSG